MTDNKEIRAPIVTHFEPISGNDIDPLDEPRSRGNFRFYTLRRLRQLTRPARLKAPANRGREVGSGTAEIS